MNKKDFLEKTVLGWIKNDIGRMLSDIPAENGRIGNINFPLALCVLSYMESLGSFLLGSDKEYHAEDKIGRYLECFNNPKEYDGEILTLIFRNGLAHSYFPRGGVSRENRRPALYKKITNGINQPIVDVETLTYDFLGSLDKFQIQLTENNFASRMDEILKEIKGKHAKLEKKIENLPERQEYTCIDVTTHDPGYISGFSGPSQE